jgi:Calx-beta domain
VEVIGDTIDQADENFFINLSNATNGTIINTQAVGTIVDNDAPPGIRIGDRTITEGDRGTQLVTFTISLSQGSSKAITVDYATANGTAIAGSDYNATNGKLTFEKGEISTSLL